MGVAEREEDESLQPDTEQDTTDNELPNPEVEGDPDADTENPDAGGEEDEEVVVSIGDEESPASEEEKAAPKWVKDLRQRQRELARENAELKAKLGTGQPAQGKPELPPKPKLADFDYDEERFEQARDAWDAKKRDIDAWEANQKSAEQARQKAVQAVHENYAKSKQALGVKNFQDLEDEVMAQFSPVQQSIVMAGAANPAAVVAALGANPKKLQELASIKDPVKFTWAAAQLETKVNVSKRTTSKPAPETTVRSGSTATTSKATLERLEAEAAKTGDRSKVIAFKRQQKAAGK